MGIVELVLQILLKAMDGQPADVRDRIWREYMADADGLRKIVGLYVPPDSAKPAA